jgi:hypothetical protein
MSGQRTGQCIPVYVDDAAPQDFCRNHAPMRVLSGGIQIDINAGDVMVWETPDQALPTVFDAETFERTFRPITN